MQTLHLLAGLAAASILYPQAFDVASIKPNHTGSRNSGYRRAPAGALNATNVTLKMLIEYAYDVRDYQVSGGPNWLDSDRYDVLAKSEPGADPGIAGTRLRVQALLSDRFKLSLHRTTKELPIFVLVPGKSGPKLTESKSEGSELVSNGHHLTCEKVSMASFAKVFLQGELGRPVVDKTGLQGEFDFTLDWAPGPGQRRAPGEREDEADRASLPGADGASLFTALQEKLGLKLESEKGPVEIVVIDHAEWASEN